MMPTAAQSHSDEMTLAQGLLDSGRLEEAEAAFRLVLAEVPEHPAALFGLGVTLRRRGDNAQAAGCFESVLATEPNHMKARLELAICQRDLGRLDAAEAGFRDVLTASPGDFNANFGLAVTLRRRGDNSGAANRFEQAHAIEPGHTSAALELASCLRDIGRFADAEILFQEILRKLPGNGRALFELGVTLRRRGDNARAAGYFERAIATDPNHVNATRELAGCLRDLGRSDEAEAAFRHVLERAPQNVEAMFGLAVTLRRRGDNARAVECFGRILVLDPNHDSARLELATCLRDLERFADAEQVFQAFLTKSPGHARALFELGVTLRRRGDNAGALDCFERAAASDPNHTSARMERAGCLRDAGRFADAESAFQEILTKMPGNARAMFELGVTLQRCRDTAGAARYFEQAIAIDANHAGARLELANCLRDLGRLDEAEAAFRGILEDKPGDIAAHFAFSRMLIDAHRLSEADMALRDMQRCVPAAFQTSWALGLLARKAGDRISALVHFMEAASLAPHHSGVRLEAASELIDQGDFADAERQIEIVLDADPDNLGALTLRGQALRRQGNHEGAFKAFEAALALHPHQSAPLVEMAVDARMLGQPDLSKRLLDLALERDPHGLNVLVQNAEHALINEDLEGALAFCRQAREKHPANPHPFLLTARVYADWAKMDEARSLLEDAARRFPWHTDISAHRIDLAMRAGEFGLAKTLCGELGDGVRRAFNLGAQAAQCAIQTGDHDAARSAISMLNATTADERAHAHVLAGRLAEDRGNYAEAMARFRTAAALNPRSHVHAEMARVTLLLLDLPATAQNLKRSLETHRTSRMLRGEAIRLSQTHIGQMLDEYLLDRDVLARLQAICGEHPDRQVAPLRAVVNAYPDHTPAAICLLSALRRCGSLRDCLPPTPGAPAFAAIPQRIIQYWDSDLPEDVAALMQTWRDVNPGHTYLRFDHADACAFMQARCAPNVLKAYLSAAQVAQRADIFRLAYLSVEGGIYADADDRCLIPLPAWMPRQAGFIGFTEEYGTMANNFVAACPAHPVLTLALGEAATAVLRGDNEMLWLSTGPGLMTRAFARVASGGDGDADRLLASSLVLTGTKIRQMVGTHCALSYKKSDRHWSRRTFRIKRAAHQAAGRG